MKSAFSRPRYYDNALIESFWGSLKNEMVPHQRFETRAQAESAIREYIEIFYNRQRRHSRIGYLAPAVFAQSFTRLAAENGTAHYCQDTSLPLIANTIDSDIAALLDAKRAVSEGVLGEMLTARKATPSHRA